MSPSMSALPPTANTLDPVQRSRLLRSTRKLGDVLGATPLIIDSESASRPGSPASRTKASVFLSHSHAASVTSLTEYPIDDSPRLVTLNKHQKHKSKQLARPIVLCLSSLPAPPPRKGSLTSSDANNNDVPARRDMAPVQDTILDDPEKLLRRKRMAKLTRTLGANIPPELVFPHHYKTRSEPPPKLDKERASPTVSVGKGSSTTSNFDQMPNIIPIPTSSDRHTHKHRSLTVGSLSASTQNRKSIRRPSTAETNAENGGPFAFIHGPVPTSDETLVRDWRGEWSIRDADKRATALRCLKG